MLDRLEPIKGYFVLEQRWQAGDCIDLDLQMEPVLVASNPRVDATRDCLAIQRGPVVYCIEDRDQEVKGRLLDVEIDKNNLPVTRWEPDLLDGVMVIDAQGQLVDNETWDGRLYRPAVFVDKATAHPVRLIAIPYYAWGNRKIDSMRVWIPEKSS